MKYVGSYSHHNVGLYNKKAQLTLSNPRDVKACKIAPIRRVSFHFTEFHVSAGASGHKRGPV